MKEIVYLEREIATFSEVKDELIKKGEYEKAAQIRDKLDSLKLKKRKLRDDASWTKAAAAPCPTPARAIGGGRPPTDWIGLLRQNVLRIINLTEHNAPGIYEPKVVEEVNSLARNALYIETTPAKEWSHNQSETPADARIRLRGAIGKKVGLEKMSFTDADGKPQTVRRARVAFQSRLGSKPCCDVNVGPVQARELATAALEKLSGDLSHDNVAAAKDILRKITG